MKKYGFRLESLLDYKTSLENKQKQEFSRALKEYTLQKEILHTLKTQVQSKQEDFFAKNKKIRGNQLIQMNFWLDGMRKKIRDHKKKVEEAENHLYATKKEMFKLMRERKTLEKLKKKHLASFKREVIKQNQLIIDDKVSFRYFLDNRKE